MTKKNFSFPHSNLLNFEIKSPSIQEVLKLVIPLAYSVGSEHSETEFELFIDSSNKHYSKLLKLTKQTIKLEDLLSFDFIQNDIEQFLHSLLKEKYKEERN